VDTGQREHRIAEAEGYIGERKRKIPLGENGKLAFRSLVFEKRMKGGYLGKTSKEVVLLRERQA